MSVCTSWPPIALWVRQDQTRSHHINAFFCESLSTVKTSPFPSFPIWTPFCQQQQLFCQLCCARKYLTSIPPPRIWSLWTGLTLGTMTHIWLSSFFFTSYFHLGAFWTSMLCSLGWLEPRSNPRTTPLGGEHVIEREGWKKYIFEIGAGKERVGDKG